MSIPRESPDSEDAWLALAGAGAGWIRAAWRDRFAAAGLREVQDFLQVQGEALSKPGLVRRYRARLNVGGDCVYLKRFEGDRLSDRLRRWWEDRRWHSPASREVAAADALRRARIPANRALAWGRSVSRGIETTFVVLSPAPGVPSDQYLQRSPGDAKLRTLAQRMAALVRAFHAGGWCHRDLYLCHIFVREGAGGDFELTLIDLQRVFRPPCLTRRWRVKDLAQLAYSARQRVPIRIQLRFFRDYLSGETRASKRRWLKSVRAKVASMDRRERRRAATSPVV